MQPKAKTPKDKDDSHHQLTKRIAKSKRKQYTPVTNIAGSKQDAERIRELDQQRQSELKNALIAELRENPPPKAEPVTPQVVRPKKPRSSPTGRKRPAIVWEGEKSEDILDAKARVPGSPFTGKRSR
jgi:hypothetical protein